MVKSEFLQVLRKSWCPLLNLTEVLDIVVATCRKGLLKNFRFKHHNTYIPFPFSYNIKKNQKVEKSEKSR